VAVDGTPGVVLVHRAPVGVRDVSTRGSSHVLGELGGFGFDETFASGEVE
jgi:hypothetical protein